MNKPILIGLAGVKSAGKDTTADFIEQFASESEPALSVRRRGFADKMKWSFSLQFFPGISMEDAIAWVDRFKNSDYLIHVPPLDKDSKTYSSIGFRAAIANFGTDSHRDVFGDDFWVDQLLPKNKPISKHHGDLPNILHLDFRSQKWYKNFINYNDKHCNVSDICLITDLRFQNERDRIKELGGYCWKIKRQDAEDVVIAEANKAGIEIHRSELGLHDDQFDVIIDNSDNDMIRAKHRTDQAIAGALHG